MKRRQPRSLDAAAAKSPQARMVFRTLLLSRRSRRKGTTWTTATRISPLFRTTLTTRFRRIWTQWAFRKSFTLCFPRRNTKSASHGFLTAEHFAWAFLLFLKRQCVPNSLGTSVFRASYVNWTITDLSTWPTGPVAMAITTKYVVFYAPLRIPSDFLLLRLVLSSRLGTHCSIHATS